MKTRSQLVCSVRAPLLVEHPSSFRWEAADEIPDRVGDHVIGGDERCCRKEVEADQVAPNLSGPFVCFLVKLLLFRRLAVDLSGLSKWLADVQYELHTYLGER